MTDNLEKRSSRKSRPRKATVTYEAQGAPVRAQIRSVRVQQMDAPPKIARSKSVHPRRVLPFVAEGQEREKHSLDTRAIIHRAEDAGQVRAQADVLRPPERQVRKRNRPGRVRDQLRAAGARRSAG